MNEEKEDICYGGLKGYGKTYCEMIRLQQENQHLHNKIDKAIEYMKPRFMNCIDNDKRYFADVYIQEIYEILKDSDVDE